MPIEPCDGNLQLNKTLAGGCRSIVASGTGTRETADHDHEPWKCRCRRDGAVPVIGYYIVAVVFEAKFAPAAIPAAAVRNLEWGAIGVGVFGLCSAAIAMAFRTIAIRRAYG